MTYLFIFFGVCILIALGICLIDGLRNTFVGDWRHLRLDDNWDPKKSRGRIKP